jgi:hypothetical protein
MEDKRFGSIKVISRFTFIEDKTAVFTFTMEYDPIVTAMESIAEFERNIFKAAEYLVKTYCTTRENVQCERVNALLERIREEHQAAGLGTD